MKGITMRLALLAAAAVIGTLGFNAPLLLVHDPSDGIVEPVQASIPPRELSLRTPGSAATGIVASDILGRLSAAGAVTAREVVRATGHVIPADHPQPPLGRFKLTAYSGPQLGQAEPITATGTSARAGRTVAVDPKVIPLGSKIYIEGLGERIAEDVGGGVKGNHIDVYLGTVPQAVRFGVRRGTVSLVEPPQKRRRTRSHTRGSAG